MWGGRKGKGWRERGKGAVNTAPVGQRPFATSCGSFRVALFLAFPSSLDWRPGRRHQEIEKTLNGFSRASGLWRLMAVMIPPPTSSLPSRTVAGSGKRISPA